MPYKQGNKWRAKVTWQGERYTVLKDTKKAAKAWEEAKKKELSRPKPATPTGMALLTFFNKYNDYAKRHFVQKTYQEKVGLTRRLIVAWGDISTEEVTPEMLLDYLEDQAASRSANAYNKDRKNIRAMWAHGCTFFGLKRNPTLGLPKISHDREPQYTPPTKDVLKVLAAATRHEKVLLDCYLNTAARRTEIFRWRWVDDVNFQRRQVRLGTHKTADGSMKYEWVPMNDILYESLWWLWQHQPIKDNPWVFPITRRSQWYGRPHTERRRFLPSICERAKVKSFGFHALRRYVASYLADEHKVSAKRIQRILRHQNVNTTEIYIHQLNEDLTAEYDLINELQKPNKKAPEKAPEKGN